MFLYISGLYVGSISTLSALASVPTGNQMTENICLKVNTNILGLNLCSRKECSVFLTCINFLSDHADLFLSKGHLRYCHPIASVVFHKF